MTDLIEKKWAEFRTKCVQPGFSEAQIEALRATFFAGAIATHKLMMQPLVDAHENDEAGADGFLAVSNALQDELDLFFVDKGTVQ